ncbi:IQ domain-containing protein J [Collichthys lucidus]|uniref:IQ domain-containing protein J n=1 Tax=Collichthys lucidus TaxID=240159 RepID=A0A4U5V094_COLLU|nr:IQ domain-containing protein J [Collichthys lucidus]
MDCYIIGERQLSVQDSTKTDLEKAGGDIDSQSRRKFGEVWFGQYPRPSYSYAFMNSRFIREKVRGEDKQTERDEKQPLEANIDHQSKSLILSNELLVPSGRKSNEKNNTVPATPKLDTKQKKIDLFITIIKKDLILEQLKSLQSGFKHVNDGGFQLQSNHLTMDLDNNININMPPIETKVLIIQRAWRDFLQRQEVEKRSPSPPSLSSSDKMSMSISMTTLSDGSTPNQSFSEFTNSERGREKKETRCVGERVREQKCFQEVLCNSSVGSHSCGENRENSWAYHRETSHPEGLAIVAVCALPVLVHRSLAIVLIGEVRQQRQSVIAEINSDKRIKDRGRLNRTFSVGAQKQHDQQLRFKRLCVISPKKQTNVSLVSGTQSTRYYSGQRWERFSDPFHQ